MRGGGINAAIRSRNSLALSPEMLLDATQLLDIDLARSFMIGDRWRDVEAGQAAGCRTVWIDCQIKERGPMPADCTAGTLSERVEWILGAGSA